MLFLTAILPGASSADDSCPSPGPAAPSLEFLCHSRKLTMLHIDPIGLSRLPACLGNLTELQWVDLRGNWLSDSSEGWAMPTSLSSWKKLKMFIAFGQSYQGCPGSEADCVLSWHAKRDLEWEEDDESRPWRCHSTGWRPKFDDPLQPWWGWGT